MSSRTTVNYTKHFRGELKRLNKKYRSVASDIEQLEQVIIEQPRTGTPLGNNTFKIRLAIKSKGKGKSGGARVITYVETEIIGIAENNMVNLLTIYDKSETDSISKEEIVLLIKNME